MEWICYTSVKKKTIGEISGYNSIDNILNNVEDTV
jgi:hypothetical protein